MSIHYFALAHICVRIADIFRHWAGLLIDRAELAADHALWRRRAALVERRDQAARLIAGLRIG